MGLFWPKYFKTKSSPTPKKAISANFKTLCYCNVIQIKKKKEKRKFHALIFDNTWEISVWAPFDPKTQNKIFLTFMSTLNLYATAHFCKKSRKFHALIFHKFWKTSIWTHYGPFLPPKLQKFLQKKKSFMHWFFYNNWNSSFWAHVVLL